jgi:hypothetical protein
VTASILTPLQLDAGAGLLQNQGISTGTGFRASVAEYQNLPIIDTLWNTIAISASNVVANISNVTITNMEYLAANICPALSDSIPPGYSFPVLANPPGFTGFLTNTANTYVGNGDVGKFAQALAIADGYAFQTNIFINSAVNSQTYLGNTFTTMNDMITAGASSVNLATQAFGDDLINLGNLFDLQTLGDLGSPLALVQRITSLVGPIPLLELIFVAEGVPEEVAVNINTPDTSVVDSVQKLMYQAMTKIQGDLLTQILTVLNVKTVGIETMADLLNPVKLFPNSYQSLTTVTANGVRAIYIDDQGTVNSVLDTELPAYVLSSVV